MTNENQEEKAMMEWQTPNPDFMVDEMDSKEEERKYDGKRSSSDLNNGNDEDEPFPHGNPAMIDLRTNKPGDGDTYPDPYSTVEFKYTGYIYDEEGAP